MSLSNSHIMYMSHHVHVTSQPMNSIHIIIFLFMCISNNTHLPIPTTSNPSQLQLLCFVKYLYLNHATCINSYLILIFLLMAHCQVQLFTIWVYSQKYKACQMIMSNRWTKRPRRMIFVYMHVTYIIISQI